MTNRVTITLTIDLPPGVTPDVAYGPADPVDLPPIDLIAEAQQVFDADEIVQAPALLSPPPEPRCPAHGPMKRYPAGVSKKNNKPYNASWRCTANGCETKPIWDRDAA